MNKQEWQDIVNKEALAARLEVAKKFGEGFAEIVDVAFRAGAELSYSITNKPVEPKPKTTGLTAEDVAYHSFISLEGGLINE